MLLINTNNTPSSLGEGKVQSNNTFLFMQTTFGSNATITALLLKECQDLRGLRDSQLTRIFLDKYGLDGIIVCDNDKAL